MVLNTIEDKLLEEARSNQSDPWVMYLIVRESLGMGVGKTAAQVAHAAALVYMNYQFYTALRVKNEFVYRFETWQNDSFRKVVLRANDEQFEQIKREIDCYLVRDAGLTEVEPGSETVIALRPMRKSERPELIVSLKSLK